MLGEICKHALDVEYIDSQSSLFCFSCFQTILNAPRHKQIWENTLVLSNMNLRFNTWVVILIFKVCQNHTSWHWVPGKGIIGH